MKWQILFHVICNSGIDDALRETFSSYKRHLKLASLVIYMVIKRTNAMHHYEPFQRLPGYHGLDP